MFIRETRKVNKETGAVYLSHQLAESVKTESGPRNRVLLYLGRLSIDKSQFPRLAALFKEALSGSGSRLFPDFVDPEEAPLRAIVKSALQKEKKSSRKERPPRPRGVEGLDPRTIETEEFRSLGPELVAHQAWERLELDHILTRAGFSPKDRALACAAVIGRLVAPASELGTHRWLSGMTALEDLQGFAGLSSVGKDALYEISDRLWEKKEEVEASLIRTTFDLFPRDSLVFLYDLSNVYMEGSARDNALARRGHSKEKRSDCPLISFSLVVDQDGHPMVSRIDPGNQSEPETLPQVLDRLEALHLLRPAGSRTRTTLVMDRGIATRENLALLREREIPYCVVERRPTEKEYAADFEKARETFEWFAPRSDRPAEGVYLKKVLLPAEKETTGGSESPKIARALVLSDSRKGKEEGMDTLKETRFLGALTRLQTAIRKGSGRNYETVLKRLGRIESAHPSVAKYYTVTPTLVAAKAKKGKTTPVVPKVSDLSWQKNEKRETRKTLTGAYVIETTHTGLSASGIWSLYTTLTGVEEAFRSLKSELGIRPVFHQGADRTRAHLFISILAYHLLSDIEIRLKAKGDTRSWSTIREILSTLGRVTTTGIDPHTGFLHTIIHPMKPEAAHREILDRLERTMPSKRRYTRTAISKELPAPSPQKVVTEKSNSKF